MDPFDDLTLSRRRVLGLAAAAAAGLALNACGSDSSSKATTTAKEAAPAGLANGRQVTIKTCVYAKNHASSMLYWQKFAPPGVKVDVKPITSSAEILQGLEGGSIDFGLLAPYVPFQTQAKSPIGSKTVSMIARQGFGLVGKVGAVEKIEDLKGKKIAIPPPGALVFVINDLLTKAGLTLGPAGSGKDVTAVNIGYALHLGALTSGDVDAFMGTEPACTQAVVNGVGVRLPGVFDTPVGNFNTALWASPAMLKDDELCRVTVKMQKDAAEYLTPNGTNDKAVWHDLLVAQFGLDEKVYERVLENVGAEWKFDKRREDSYVAVGKAMVASGDLKAEPDYEAFYARQYWTV